MAEVGEGHCWLCGGGGKADEDDIGGVVSCAREEGQCSAGEEEEGEEGKEGGSDKGELVAIGHRHGNECVNKHKHSTTETACHNRDKHSTTEASTTLVSSLTLSCTLAVPAVTAIRFIKQKPKKQEEMDLQPRQRLAQPPSSMASRKNTKKLTLALPSSPPPTVSLFLRRDEDGPELSVPYADGPIQVIPGLWIGSEDNARDWNALLARGIRSILNVAKEVSSPFDAFPSTTSSQNSNPAVHDAQSTYYPPHLPTGRPPMHYLKLQWSHGQKDLVNDGFQAGMAFADAAKARGDGVIVQSVSFSLTSPALIFVIAVSAASLVPLPW